MHWNYSMRALLQVADTGPLESLAVMLRSAGIEPCLPSRQLRDQLRDWGCDTVLEIDSLVKGWGYDRPFAMRELSDFNDADLIVDIKAHRNGPIITRKLPRFEGRILWYRINGGQPEHVPGHGDEVNPGCPILTPNQWYTGRSDAYVCWPPFYRIDEYYDELGRSPVDKPICLIHNLHGWGYQALSDNMRKLGVRCYGLRSPDGMIRHSEVAKALSRALCVVHLKSNDAPGYALYEALAARCPVVCTRRLIWRCKMQELFVPNDTCLVFDRETHDGLTDEDVERCTEEVREAILRLTDPSENERIGTAGYRRLMQIMWNEKQDNASLSAFMRRNFPWSASAS